MFKQHELEYISQVVSEERETLGIKFKADDNELSIVSVDGVLSFIYFGDTQVYEFEQDVV